MKGFRIVPDSHHDTAPSSPSAGMKGRTSRAKRISALIDRMADARSFRLRVALTLAAISLVSAYVSYVATERAGAAASLNALASQQWAEEQQAEQQLDAMISQDERLTVRLDEHLHAFQSASARADAMRVENPGRAAQLDLEAQSSAAQYLQVLPFFRAAQPDVSTGSAIYDATAAQAVTRLQDPRLFRVSSGVTREDASRAAETAASTVLVVVILVAALFLLTLAHVAGGRRGLVLATAGAATAIAGIVFFSALEIGAALPLFIGATVVVIALFMVRVPRIRDWLQGMDREGVAGDVADVPTRPGTAAKTDPRDPPASRFTRYIAIAIAVVTLLGAGIGYLHEQASESANHQAWSARDLGVEEIGALRSSEEKLAVSVASYQEALNSHIDSWNASQAAWYDAWSGDATEAERRSLESQSAEDLAVRQEEHSGLGDELGNRGVSSEEALRDLRAEVWGSSSKLAGLQDAANSASETWGGRAAIYLSVLAWLAVAAYLLGLSLVFRDRRVRMVLASVGTLLIVASVARGGTTWADPPPTTGRQVEAAANAYSAGMVASLSGNPAEAEAFFATAIKLRPDFGIASREQATSLMEMGSSSGLGYRAAFTRDSVSKAIAALEVARANRADTAGVRLNLGAMLFHRSLQTGSMADMQQSVASTRAGLALGEEFERKNGSPHINQLIGELNLGLGLLGTGDFQQSESVYRAAGERIRTLPPYLRRYLVSAALTPLDLLRGASNPPPDEQITAMKELVVRQGYGLITRPESPAAVTSARVELFASLLQWRAIMSDFDPERDTLAVQWYRFDPVVNSWNVLPIMSGPLSFGKAELAGSFNADAAAGENAYWGNVGAALTDIPSTCVRPGQYRVELYLNGRLGSTAEGDSPADLFSSLLARDVGVGMCHPSDWTVSGTPGLSTNAVSPDGSRGVVVFRIQQPGSPAGADPQATALDRVVQGTLAGLPLNLTSGSAIDPTTESTVFGTTNSTWRRYEYPGGIAHISATAFNTGTITVVCRYGPEDWVMSDEASKIILSIITL